MSKIEVYSGSHGIGKTTAIKSRVYELMDEDKQVMYMNEVARDCPYPLDATAAYEWMLAESREQMATAKMAKALGVYVIMDRCPLDYKVYALVRHHIHNFDEQELREELACIDTLHFLRTEGRDHMFVDDGFRDLNYAFRHRIDEVTAQLILTPMWREELNIISEVGPGFNQAA